MEDKTPMERFESLLGKIVKVTKEDFDKAAAAEKHLAEEIEGAIEPRSEAGPTAE